MRRRKLRPEELDLWKRVSRTAQPLAGALNRPAPELQPEPNRRSPKMPPRFELPPAHPTKNESHLPRLVASPSQAQAMDRKTFGRMRRGKLVPEARLDLHGMTLNQAHPELIQFILTAHARGLRLVLVITGKGQRDDPYDPMPRRRGVLKQQVPVWLRMPPLQGAVLEVAEAHVRHGGGGAFYVYLRRRKA